MPKTAEEVLTGLLSTSYKLDETGVTALKEADGSFKDDSIDHLLKLDAERVATLRGDPEKLKAENYSRGKREALEALEKELKDEFGVKTSDVKGTALIKQIIAEKIGSANGDLTDDKIKASKLYRELEEHMQTKEKSFADKLKEHEEKLRSEFNSVRDTESVLDQAKAIFKGMKPKLPKNDDVAAAQMSLLDNFVKGHKFQITRDKDGKVADVVVMKEDGSGRLEDQHGHAVKFDDLIRTGARRFYEFEDDERKQGAPDPKRSGSSDDTGDHGGAYDPKTTAEYAQLWKEINQSYQGSDRIEQWRLLKEAGVKNGVVS